MGLPEAVFRAQQMQAEMQALLDQCLEEKKKQQEEERSTGEGMPDAFADYIGLMFLHLRGLLWATPGRGFQGRFPGIGPDFGGGFGSGRR